MERRVMPIYPRAYISGQMKRHLVPIHSRAYKIFAVLAGVIHEKKGLRLRVNP
jgi:hypothetical protein